MLLFFLTYFQSPFWLFYLITQLCVGIKRSDVIYYIFYPVMMIRGEITLNEGKMVLNEVFMWLHISMHQAVSTQTKPNSSRISQHFVGKARKHPRERYSRFVMFVIGAEKYNCSSSTSLIIAVFVLLIWRRASFQNQYARSQLFISPWKTAKLLCLNVYMD